MESREQKLSHSFLLFYALHSFVLEQYHNCNKTEHYFIISLNKYNCENRLTRLK
jgi:hypothetical protein